MPFLLADDSVGLWQVMPHPSRSGWTRLLYSCKVKLQPWVPEFVVNSLTKSALTEVGSYLRAVVVLVIPYRLY